VQDQGILGPADGKVVSSFHVYNVWSMWLQKINGAINNTSTSETYNITLASQRVITEHKLGNNKESSSRSVLSHFSLLCAHFNLNTTA